MLYSPTLQEVGNFSALLLRTSVCLQSGGNSQCDESFSESRDYLAACRVTLWKLMDDRPARKSVNVYEVVNASMREQVG